MDIKIHIEEADGNVNTIEAPTDMSLSLMEILKASDYPVAATCGGMALCASCHVEVLDNTYQEEANDAEMDMLLPQWRRDANETAARLAWAMFNTSEFLFLQ